MCCKDLCKSGAKRTSATDGEASPARTSPRVPRFLRDQLAPFLYRVRYASVLLTAALGGTGIAVRMTLFEPAESIPLFKDTHPWEVPHPHSRGAHSAPRMSM